MQLKLPRPYKPKLPFREAMVLDCLSKLDTAGDGIVTADADLLSSMLALPAADVEETLLSLNCRRCILLGSKQFAILSRLSTKLKQERDRNRIRTKRGQSVDWTLHRKAAASFPSLRGPVVRPASYNRPAVFEALLSEHTSFHKRDCPANVEIITEACYPGELSSVLTFIEEQRSANRSVVLLYTRKAVYVGVIRAPKR